VQENVKLLYWIFATLAKTLVVGLQENQQKNCADVYLSGLI